MRLSITEKPGLAKAIVAGLNGGIHKDGCYDCDKPLRRTTRKDKNAFFWGCAGFTDGCKFACEDKAGSPVPKQAPTVSSFHKCLACGKGLSRRPGKKKGTFWWSCSGFPDCKQTYPNTKGKPVYSTHKA